MASIVFYEKPGCINNTKQKKILKQAGHKVDARNLLAEQWTAEMLLKYFSCLPVDSWFNQAAPDVKSGAVIPENLSINEALDLMLKDPLLIRRPLMRVGDVYKAGFEADEVSQWIGLKEITEPQDLENCPQQKGHSCNIIE